MSMHCREIVLDSTVNQSERLADISCIIWPSAITTSILRHVVINLHWILSEADTADFEPVQIP